MIRWCLNAPNSTNRNLHKKKLVILGALFSSHAFAADLNLKGGESAVIEANVNTHVTCGGNSSDGGGTCAEKCQ